MNDYSFVDSRANKWRRVSKARARKLYDAGRTIGVCPCNMRPDGPWHPMIETSNADGHTFDSMVASAEYYNCDNERGRYLSFYYSAGPEFSIRAPRFSQGGPGAGYVTADTIELHINGYRVKYHEWPEYMSKLADLINAGELTRRTMEDTLAPLARALWGRVAW